MVATEYKKIPRLGLSQIMKMRSDRFGTLCRLPQTYRDIVAFNFLGNEIRVMMQPELIQHILVRNVQNYTKDRGYRILGLLLGNGLVTNPDYSNWRKQRTLLQPPFHRESLHNMCDIVVSSTERLLERWRAKEGQTVNFTHDMAWLTIDIVSKTLFTADVSDEQIGMIWDNINYLNETSIRLIRNPYHIPWRFPMPRYIKGRKSIAQLDELIYGIIRRRKEHKDPPRDLLQLLIESRYDDGSAMTDEQIRDEVMTVFVAGHETTVNALSWTWYLLKKHPDAERRLAAESAPYAQRHPGFGDIPALTYGSHVMNESMRMYPPVPAIGRMVSETDEANGYLLKKGTFTVINISGMHHHPDYWDRPFEFMPERFATFDTKGQNRFVFMPFGAGPRICIGNNFAIMEMQLINAMLSARVDMELVSTHIEPEPLITLKPAGGVVVRIKKVS